MGEGTLALASRQAPAKSSPGVVPERRASSDCRHLRSAQKLFDVGNAVDFGDGDFNPLHHLIRTRDANDLDAADAQSSFFFLCHNASFAGFNSSILRGQHSAGGCCVLCPRVRCLSTAQRFVIWLLVVLVGTVRFYAATSV